MSNPDYPRDRPTVPEVRALVESYYAKPGNGCGGTLHSALDDGNLDTTSLMYHVEYAKSQGDSDGLVIAHKLLAMTPTQRRKVYRTSCHENDDYTPVDPSAFADLRAWGQ